MTDVQKAGRGRPEAVPTKLTRQLARDLGLSGRSPLHVMVRNMLFWDETATQLGDRLKEVLSADGAAVDAKETASLLKQFLEAQSNAQSCAVDAAPYCHPKLQSIAIKKDHGKEAPLTMTLPHPEGEDRSYRSVGESTGVVPDIVELHTGEDGVTDRREDAA